MRNTIFLILALFFLLSACSKTDHERLIGIWIIDETIVDGELMFSSDQKKQDQIIDRVLQMQMAQLPPEAREEGEMMRNMFVKQMRATAKTTFEIKEDDSYVSVRQQGETEVKTDGKIVLDEANKKITLKSNSNEQFTYRVDEQLLKLSGTSDGSKIELTFKRKS